MDTKYKLSFCDTFAMALGFSIGSGIITLTGIGIGMTGRSVFLAFPVCALLFLISFRPLFIMSSVHPTLSAAYNYSSILLGKKAGGFYCYIYLFGRLTIAIFGLSFAQYAASLLPSLNTPFKQRAIAAALLTVFYAVNLMGIKAVKKMQNVLSLVLIIGLLSYVIFGIPKVQADFFRVDFFTGGMQGFCSAVSLLFFAVGGSYIITDFAPMVQNPSKVIMKVVIIVTLSVTALYMLIGIVASGTDAVENVSWMPLSITAKQIYPAKMFYFIFIIFGAMGALVTTLNSSFVWYSASLKEACNDGWLPKSWAKDNKYGVPYKLITLFYLLGLVPTILGIDLNVISKVAVGMTILSSLIPMAGVIRLPHVYPDEWKKSKYSISYSRMHLFVMVIISYIIMMTQVFSLFSDNPPMANIIIIVYVFLVGVYLILKKER